MPSLKFPDGFETMGPIFLNLWGFQYPQVFWFNDYATQVWLIYSSGTSRWISSQTLRPVKDFEEKFLVCFGWRVMTQSLWICHGIEEFDGGLFNISLLSIILYVVFVWNWPYVTCCDVSHSFHPLKFGMDQEKSRLIDCLPKRSFVVVNRCLCLS